MTGPIHELLDAAAAAHAGKNAVVSDERVVTYGELAEESKRAAGWLRRLGVRRGDRVALVLPNCVDAVTVVYAASRLGASFVVLNDGIKPYHLRHVVDDAEPAVLLLSDAHAGAIETGAGTTIVTQSDLRRALEEGDALDELYPGITSDVACLIYTSGSTAKPKGVVSTHRNVRFAAAAIQVRLGIQTDDVVGTFVPLSFDYGLYQVFLAAQVGATLALGDARQAGPGLLTKLRAWGVTGLPLVPSIASTLLRLVRRTPQRDLPSLRFFTNTGARLAPEVVDELNAKFPEASVFVMFGLTECKRVSILDPGDFARKRASVGTPLPDTECLVVDEHGRVLPPGAVGELVVRGPHVMPGYWRAPELTAARFRTLGDGSERALFTGDTCSLDEDGYLYFHGRHDDVYKSRGFRVSALEVEDAAAGVPGVWQAALVPPQGGRGATLFLSGEVDAHEIQALLRDRLEDYKLPDEIVRMRELPLNVNGKIDKQVLARNGHVEEVTAR